MNVLHKADLRINAAEIKMENVRIYNFSDKKIPIGLRFTLYESEIESKLNRQQVDSFFNCQGIKTVFLIV